MPRVHAFRDDALADHDAVGLVEALRAGRVGTAEVVEAAIARTEAVDPHLGAVAHRAYDRARAEGRDPRGGWFAGVPTFVKDNADVAGMPTQHGADAFTAAPPRRDGDLARMYLATGLVPLGKTRLSEFGFSPAAEHARQGPVRNPWSTDHTAGASSAGSAALVAAGAVPIAHANDGGGSIRIPAAACGLVGLKPTRGRLAQDVMNRTMPVRIVADGVVTRSVRDTAALLREAERVYRALHLPPVGDVTRPGRRRLRVAVVTAAAGRTASPEVAALTRRTADLLAGLGHHVEEAASPAPPSFAEDFLLHWGLLATAIVRTGRLTYGRSWDLERCDPLTRGLDRLATRNLHRLPGAIRRLRQAADLGAAFHERYDVVLSPTLATTTPRVGHLDPSAGYDQAMERILSWVAFTPWQNVTGEPAVSLPLATSAEGLPLGMMLGAGAGREPLLLGLALELEEAAPFARITAPAGPGTPP
ncbi:amidase [Nocardioides marmotae]|uniref:Amidase n=1 Tax=Nocardioides marmotae TaxID=2663857 RepID=A0A6I3ITD6_9ACTN|nr:amidase [Nocardioides marmotae]MCR6030162.1 amidase [Gordonia jinghuaiqii]MBC9733042.1 amidase [Nocardioides marmotae]MTB84156.1 amidase [Nocardioides marmotae]MTB93793.1 amidase [Nocardioides marmotae]QKE00127.1 amidase [Nocardioides marmotae]